MDQLAPTPTPLLTKAQLKEWLGVSDMWVRMRLADDPEFVERCVIDIATPGSTRQTLRFHYGQTAEYLGIPVDSKPTPIAA